MTILPPGGGEPGMAQALGRLEPVALRQVWAHEAQSFTPWLKENVDGLAEALGIEIELTGSEHPVGGFALDLIGIDRTHSATLIIENQLEGTDHDHLGKIVTYASGTDAQTIIWIARDFREEHRQALDWLNEHTDEDIRFFGIQIQLVRIGTSPPAPLLNVVAKPNDWQKQVKTAAKAETTSGKALLYTQFWTRFLERMQHEAPSLSRATKPGSWNWINLPGSPVKGTWYLLSFVGTPRELHFELYIDDASLPERNPAILAAFKVKQQEMEHLLGAPLTFDEKPGRRATRIFTALPGADVTDVDRHDEFITWIFGIAPRFKQAIASVPISI